MLIEQQEFRIYRDRNYKKLKSGYFIFPLIASTELYLLSLIIIAKWRFSLGCCGRSIGLLPLTWWKLREQWNKVVLRRPHSSGEERGAAEGSKRTVIAQGRKSDSPVDQLGQKLPGDGSLFRRLPSTSTYSGLQASGQTLAAISTQPSAFNYCCTPLKPQQEHIPALETVVIICLESMAANWWSYIINAVWSLRFKGT